MPLPPSPVPPHVVGQVHENDATKGGCPFKIFFDGRTPEDRASLPACSLEYISAHIYLARTPHTQKLRQLPPPTHPHSSILACDRIDNYNRRTQQWSKIIPKYHLWYKHTSTESRVRTTNNK